MVEPNPLARGPQERLEITRLEAGQGSSAFDEVAREEPLQLQIDGMPLAILLRTPGSDLELALGLMHAEGIIHRLSDVAMVRLAPSGQVVWPDSELEVRADPEAENLVDVHLRIPLPPGDLGWQRHLPSSSACGICGSATMEAVQRFQAPVLGHLRWPMDRVFNLPRLLAASQPVFRATGGLHAAGIVAWGTQEMEVAEDVGRHNAVDKLVGRALLEGRLPLTDSCLVVSGRAGFEIVQKAAAAQVSVVAAISAPSSMAVQTARTLGVTLVGFLRAETGNVYSRPERLEIQPGIERW
ncbi:MAG: formate dehydrogenase accessory sulfurtransferase FdhD [Candidatus Dormibacteria bacterium]